MKRLILISTLSFIYLTAFSQGIYNNGAHIVVSSDTYLVVDGASGNLQNESGVIDLSGKLKLDGNFSNNVTAASAFGTLASGSEVIFAGTGTQTIGGSSTAVFSFDKLTVNSGATVQATAGKQLTLNSDLTNNGTFTIDASDEEQSTVKISGSVSGAGTYNMQAYLTAGRNWYVSSPVSGAKSSVFNAASNPVYWYDEEHGTSAPWVTISDNTTDLIPYRGYIATVPTNGNVTFTGGAFNNSDEIITLYRTAGQTKEGFNLVGNPYPAYFDYDAATKQDIMETFWLRSRNEANNGWIFDTFNTLTNLGTSPSGKHTSGKIPPMQAFWVRVSPTKASGTISIAKSLTSHVDNAANIRRAPQEEQRQFVRLRLYKDASYDETLVAFFPGASDAADNYDSPKMLNASATVPDIYSKAGSESMAINSLTTFEGERRIPLYYNTRQTGDFKITANEISGFSPMGSVKLYDVALGTEHNLLLDGDYIFQSEAVNNASRFELIVKIPGITTQSNTEVYDGVQFIDRTNGQVEIRIADKNNTNTKYTVHNAIGQLVQSAVVTQNSTLVKFSCPAGVYHISLSNGEKVYCHKILIN